MKKTFLSLFAATTLMLSSCMTPGMGTTSNTGGTSDVLTSVLGAVLSNVLFGGQSGILGSWNYTAPSTAFTSEKTLTQAGGSAAIAKRYTDLGFYLGIGGSCTYSKNEGRYIEFIRDLPLLPMDRIVLETDAPYLIPTGCRGRRNNSLNLSAVVSTLAQAQNMTAEEVEMITERNAKECFFNNYCHCQW